MARPAGQTKKVVMQDAVTGTGNGTAIVVSHDATGGFTVLSVQITGINGDTLTFEGTIDGTNFVSLFAQNVATGEVSTTTTVNGIFRVNVQGMVKVRVRVSTYSAGTITATGVLIFDASAIAGDVSLVGAADLQVEITPTLDTNAYTSGDVLFLETELVNAARTSGGEMLLHSVKVVDKDDQGAGIDLFFFDRTVTFGAKNGVPSISDADAAYYEGKITVSSYNDLGGVKVATVPGNGLGMHANATSLFVTAMTQGTPTHTASGLILKFYFIRA